ncbi:MAG: metallophosphoesterase [Pseudomonadota bacterium]
MWNAITSFISPKSAPTKKIRSYSERRKFALPDGVRIYAIGDIHGCADLLKHKVNLLYSDLIHHSNKKNIFVGMGDYIDRGPASSKVIDILINDLPSYIGHVFLTGNHEQFMQYFMEAPEKNVLWLEYGGIETLRSYDVHVPKRPFTPENLQDMAKELKENIPTAHKEFFANMRLSYTAGDYFFVHAGINPKYSINAQNDKDLTTIRTSFIDSQKIFEKRIVHGHTPAERIEALPNRFNLDTGAYLSGNLSMVAFEKSEHFVIDG